MSGKDLLEIYSFGISQGVEIKERERENMCRRM